MTDFHQSDRAVMASNGQPPSLAATVLRELATDDEGAPIRSKCAKLFTAGQTAGRRRVEQTVRVYLDGDERLCEAAGQAIGEILTTIAGWDVRLTGAEAVAAVLAEAGVESVFVYPGTSELAVCDAIESDDDLRCINGRGDKESAFMAAGASLLRPGRGAAVLHGARGATNAMGALADARRNEAGTVMVLGLPSTSSTPFLPPHGEERLETGVSSFSDWMWFAPPVPGDESARRCASLEFVTQLRRAIEAARTPPFRPAIFGVPQDVAEAAWVSLSDLAGITDDVGRWDVAHPSTNAVKLVGSARRPVVLIDDYALRYDDMRSLLHEFSTRLGAPVLQLRYRRGPMLFERLQRNEVENFVGWLDPFDDDQVRLLAQCDLLITVEDRNLYERVTGKLPGCPHVAINSDGRKSLKNGRIGEDDALLVGEPPRIIADLIEELEDREHTAPRWYESWLSGGTSSMKELPDPDIARQRGALVQVVADVLGQWENPVLVDDSQMFGGLLSDHYDRFPPGLRVFGGHGGFVGGGLAIAVGLAIGNPEYQVLCTLGDQGFVNSFQGLVAAHEQQAPVTFIVCNNGQSVSLNKQARAALDNQTRHYLNNVPDLSYCAVGQALGVTVERVSLPIGSGPDAVRAGTDEFGQTLRRLAAVDGPSLVELVLPSDPAVWRGIWITQGFEERTLVNA